MGILKDVSLFGGISLGIGAVISLLLRKEVKYSLILEATSGGTVSPSPRTYNYDSVTSVMVTAIPYEGYEFDGWFLSGERVSTELMYTVDVSGIILLIASFRAIGAPPLIPAYIRPIQNAVAEQWWKCGFTTELLTYTLHLGVSYQASGYVKFRICDVAGNGVSGQKIAVYTDPNPDELDFGYVYLNDAERTLSNPLILTSDANGVVAVKVDYRWIEPNSDYRDTIGYGAKVAIAHLWGGAELYPIKDGHYINKPSYYVSLTRMRHPIFRNINYIHAYWVDNPNLPVWGDAYVDCMIKIEDKLYGD